MRKKNNLLTIFFILINLIFIIIPITVSSQSQSIRVQGYIYINDVRTTPDEVSLILPNQMRYGDIDDNNGKYTFIFPEVNPGTKGTFLVVIGYKSFKPIESLTIREDVFEYYIDLHIEVSEDEIPEEPADKINLQPIASAGGPYFEIVNKSIEFNGMESYDNDGTITKYKWEFGDGETKTGAAPTYTYRKTGIYRIILTVTDNKGKNDLDITYAYITETPNNPPNKPIINVITSGSINIQYNFSILSIDTDNDKIQYLIDWGDNIDPFRSNFLQNGTTHTTNHSWIYPGIFTITAYAIDEKGVVSPATRQNILINTIYCNNIGYITDFTGDGTYDLFHSNTSGIETPVEHNDESIYFIDIDNTGDYDYQYDIKTNNVKLYKEQDTNKEKISIMERIYSNIIYIIIVLIFLIIILLIVIHNHKLKDKYTSIQLPKVKQDTENTKPNKNQEYDKYRYIDKEVDKLLLDKKKM
jgi:PKD repeat protein